MANIIYRALDYLVVLVPCTRRCTLLCWPDCNNCWLVLSKEIQAPSLVLPCDWSTLFLLSSQLAPSATPSHLVGPPGVVAWLHQKLIYLSNALDVYCSTFHRVRHPHWLTLSDTHTHPHRKEKGHRIMHPGDSLSLQLDLLILTLTLQSAQLG